MIGINKHAGEGSEEIRTASSSEGQVQCLSPAPSLRDTYNRDGYVVVKNVVDKLLVESAVTAIKIITGGKTDRQNYISSLAAAAKLPDIYDIFRSVFLTDSLNGIGLKNFLMHAPVVHIMRSEKLSDVWYETFAHQDWPSIQGSIDMVVAWIPLTDANVGNFPLEVIPKSHKNGLVEGKLNGSVLEIECDDKDFFPIECEVGDTVLMSGFLIHRTGKGNGYRISVSSRFDNLEESTFVERAYSCVQNRIVDRHMKWIPSLESIKKVFL